MADSEMDVSKHPPCKVLLRSKDGVEVYEISDTPNTTSTTNQQQQGEQQRPFLCQGATSIPVIASPDGDFCYVHINAKGILKCPIPEHGAPISTTTEPFFPTTETVQMMDLSPTGAYLLTWERWNETTCPNNLKLFQTSTGKLLAAFPQRNVKRDVWPYLQWTYDEQYAAVLGTNEVRFYPALNLLNNNSDDPAEVRFSDKLRIPNIASFSMPPHSTAGLYFMTAFVPGDKNKPAQAGWYHFTPSVGAKGAGNIEAKPLQSKSLFQAEDMKVHWSPVGDAALLTLQTTVDTSGQSYYGSSQLFLMKHGEPDVLAVPLPQEGPVASVGWLPDASKPPCFVVVAGKMPALASLHNGKTGKATFLFGNAHRNVASWAPHGRFLCLGGFGNLAGGMSFWDRNKQKLIAGCVENASGQLRAEFPVVGYDWSPSSRWFLCSTCSPRMNVENGVRLFKYNGQAIPSQQYPWNNDHYAPNKLLQAFFVPAKPTVYPDRPQSPPPEGFNEALQAADKNPQPAAAATKALDTTNNNNNNKSSGGRYVPPSARNRAGNTLADRMRQEKEGKLQTATKVVEKPAIMSAQGTVVVGLAPVQKSKSALKREKEKKKKQEKQQQEEALQRQWQLQEEALQQQQEQLKAQQQQQEQEKEQQQVDPEKRARKIKKILKQIEDLKQKDPSSLNDDQKVKIASETELLAELEQLAL